MRVRVEVQADYNPEKASDLPNVIAEEKKKLGNGEWQAYGIIVEYEVPGREDVWQSAASYWGFLADAGLDGTFDKPEDIGSDYLKEGAEQLWDQALFTLKEIGRRMLTAEEREMLQEAARKDVQAPPRGEGQPLGKDIKAEYSGVQDVIGVLEKSLAGNTVIPIGRTFKPSEGTGWHKIGHVVLSPREREILITELIAQR